MSKVDQIFKNNIIGVRDFEFNQSVAEVFDDMVSRSVPFYDEIHKIILDLSNYAFKDSKNPVIYDLGCSTGTTLKILSKKLFEMGLSPHLIGIDSSAPMLEQAKFKLDGSLGKIDILNEDLTNFNFDDPADLVVMNYTLQFIPTGKRFELLKKVYESLRPNRYFLLTEKIKTQKNDFDDLITDLYYDFKARNGYSKLEIAQKREALENVMKPITPAEQLEALSLAGFKKSEMIFRWYNFACYLCLK